jgi:hypothetical protein
VSYERGLAALNLEMTDKIAHTEYLDHDDFIKKVTGIDTTKETDHLKVKAALCRALDYDLVWNNHEMPLPAGARETKLGHAVYSNIDNQDNEVYCPFKDEDDVLNFDPVLEYGIEKKTVMVSYFKERFEKMQKELMPNTLVPGGRYNTLFSACIRTFGWEAFLSTVYEDNYEGFNKILDGFYKITRAEIEAWAETGIKAFITHDDICWTSGGVFNPLWYRTYVFPKYKKMWEPLKEAGIKVLFCADGTFTEFVDDIIEAGADGLIMEPTTDMESIAEKYGKSKVLIGNMDCRILQFNSREEIYNEVKRCADIGKKCPGYFMAVGNHIPNGIPLENVEYYFECLNELSRR